MLRRLEVAEGVEAFVEGENAVDDRFDFVLRGRNATPMETT